MRQIIKIIIIIIIIISIIIIIIYYYYYYYYYYPEYTPNAKGLLHNLNSMLMFAWNSSVV